MVESQDLMSIIGAGLSSPAVSSVVATLITTLFYRKNASTTELEKLKAGKFMEVTNELLASGKMSYLEFYRCNNFLKVAKIADKTGYNNDSAERVAEFSFDWLMRFFDAVGNVSNEDLQQLWGEILANEIKTPQTCSLRTLDIMRNMSPEEAKTFNQLCKYVLNSGASYYIFPYGFYDEKEGFSLCHDFMIQTGIYSTGIIPLLEMGLITSAHDLAFRFDANVTLQVHNEKVLCLITGDGACDTLLEQDAYFLTASGIELYEIVKKSSSFDADMDYSILCFRQMKKDNPNLAFSAYRILEYSDEPICDLTDLLE